MMLRAPAVVSPMVLPNAWAIINTPSPPLPSAVLPEESVPMKLPCTRLEAALEPLISTPFPKLPKIVLDSSFHEKLHNN